MSPALLRQVGACELEDRGKPQHGREPHLLPCQRVLAHSTDALLTTPFASSPHAALCHTERTPSVGLRWQLNRALEPRGHVSLKPAATSTFFLSQLNLAEMFPVFVDHSSRSLPLLLHVIFAPAAILTGCVLVRYVGAR